MSIDQVDLLPRIDRRRWRRRLRARRKWLVAAGVVATLALVVWVVFFSSLLGLRTLEVKGAQAIPAAQVRAAAGVATGTPLVRVNLDAVEARVEAIPAVASATVHRAWPHTIVISLTERQPVAAVYRDGTWWVMDKTGVLFRKTPGGPAPDEPTVELTGHPSQQTLPQVGSVLGALPQSLLTSTQRVSASSIDSITLLLKNGSQVKWGSAADSSEKAVVLQALMSRKAAIYDVSIPSQPATKS